MLTRNIGGGVDNGTRGIVQEVKENKDPVININGNIITVQGLFLMCTTHNNKRLLPGGHNILYN